MTIKSSGSLSFSEIEAEWDNSTPLSLSEFYAGGSTVYAGATDGSGNAIPSSGAISFSDFYDTTYFQTTSASSTTGTVAVPAAANAIYIVTAFGAGGGGYTGGEYDKAGGESAGSGGAGGAYAAGVYLGVTGGTNLTISVGSGGSGTDRAVGGASIMYSGNAGNGGATTIVNSSGTTILSLGGGTGASASGGGVKGPLRSNHAGNQGTASVSGQVTSGTTSSGATIGSGTLASGSPGVTAGNCGGDNCRIGGGAGGNNGAGANGGSGGSSSGSGTAGADGGTGGGGGGGASQVTFDGSDSVTPGGDGGDGSISYQFVRYA